MRKDKYIEKMNEELGNYEDWEYIEEGNFGELFCICGHSIKRNHKIRNKIDKIEKIIGICCAKRFFPKDVLKEYRMKKCLKCGRGHRNKKYDLCKYCGKCWHKIFLMDCRSCSWIDDSEKIKEDGKIVGTIKYLSETVKYGENEYGPWILHRQKFYKEKNKGIFSGSFEKNKIKENIIDSIKKLRWY